MSRRKTSKKRKVQHKALPTPTHDPQATSQINAAATPKHSHPSAIGEDQSPVSPPNTFQSAAAFRECINSPRPAPVSYTFGDDLDWDAPWVDVQLRVELPFWLLVENTALQIDVGGHEFPVSIQIERFELHGGQISDSKQGMVYNGRFRNDDDLPDNIKEYKKKSPDANFLWRKSKTVLTIVTRCNEDVWRKCTEEPSPTRPSVALYLDELCRAHIPVVNKVIQGYRLATYDPMVFEVAPWDIPCWLIEREGTFCKCLLVPYKSWDHPIMGDSGPEGQLELLTLTNANLLQTYVSTKAHPGELDLLDAINFMERGNYSDAIRRITTAIEVIVSFVAENLVHEKEGPHAARKFIKDTQVNFPKRIEKYEQLSGRVLPDGLRKMLDRTRKLRHRIVHGGYRISPTERGNAQKSVDFGRWTFNWFENDEQRKKIREQKIAHRSFGREMTYNIFRSEITPEGIMLSPLR